MPDEVTALDDFEFAPDLLDKIIRLLCNIADRSSIVSACLNKLGLTGGDVDAAIDQAQRKLTRAADFHRDHEFGRAVTRINELYQRAVTVQDTKTALAAQRELNKLLDLYPGFRLTDDDDTADRPAGDTDAPAADPRSDLRRADPDAVAIMDAIDMYLEPLALPDPDAPAIHYADLIRLAGDEIESLRARLSRKRKPKPKAKAKAAKKAKRTEKPTK